MAQTLLRAPRQRLAPLEESRVRRRKLGELRQVATLSWPDIRSRLARLAAPVNSLRDSDMYRVDDLVRKVKAWPQDAVLKKTPISRPITPARGAVDGRMRARGRKAHCGTMTLANWSDGASGR